MFSSLKQWFAKTQEEAGPTNQDAKKQQQKILIMAGVVCLAFLLCVLLYQGNTKKSEPLPLHPKTRPLATVDSPINNIGSKEEWLEKAQGELRQQEQATNRLSEMTQQTLQAEQQLQTAHEEQKTNLDELVMKIATLEETIEQLKSVQSTNSSHDLQKEFSEGHSAKPAATVQMIQIPLTTPKAASALPKTPHNYIPLGSHVTAVLIGGVDVSAAVTASSNPRVVYLRTQGEVRLPGNQTTPLQNCYLLGSSWGDVSSERAYVRLARMSCERHGVSVEYDVKGNVFGPDGREGIRGLVVMRDGALVGRAFLGGLISGLGDTYSNNYMDTSTSALGSVQTVKNGAALQYGVGQGMQKAADMYADYNIRRAEQYQPVIEISAGTVADIVFAEGFYVDGDLAHTEDLIPEEASAQASPLLTTSLQLQTLSAIHKDNAATTRNTFP